MNIKRRYTLIWPIIFGSMFFYFIGCNDQGNNSISTPVLSSAGEGSQLTKKGNSYSAKSPWIEYREAVEWDGQNPPESGNFYHIKGRENIQKFYSYLPRVQEQQNIEPQEPSDERNSIIQFKGPVVQEVIYFPSDWSMAQISEYISNEAHGTIAQKLYGMFSSSKEKCGPQLASNRFWCSVAVEATTDTINAVAFCNTDDSCTGWKYTQCRLITDGQELFFDYDLTFGGAAPQFMYATQEPLSECVGWVNASARSAGCEHDHWCYDGDTCP